MDTKEKVLVNNFSERLPGEAAERVVTAKRNFLSYYGRKSGERFTLYRCIHFGLAFF
jgi:hypothetical protein